MSITQGTISQKVLQMPSYSVSPDKYPNVVKRSGVSKQVFKRKTSFSQVGTIDPEHFQIGCQRKTCRNGAAGLRPTQRGTEVVIFHIQTVQPLYLVRASKMGASLLCQFPEICQMQVADFGFLA